VNKTVAPAAMIKSRAGWPIIFIVEKKPPAVLDGRRL